MWSSKGEVPLPHEEFDDVFRREYPGLLGFATLLVGDPELARDLTQEAFTRAFASWRRVGDYDRPGAWIRRVLIRLAGRAKARRREQPLDPSIEAAEEGDREMHHVLRGLIAALPLQQRAAVLLTYYEGYPAAEAAEAMGCSESTVRVHLHRARKQLAASLGLEVDDAGR